MRWCSEGADVKPAIDSETYVALDALAKCRQVQHGEIACLSYSSRGYRRYANGCPCQVYRSSRYSRNWSRNALQFASLGLACEVDPMTARAIEARFSGFGRSAKLSLMRLATGILQVASNIADVRDQRFMTQRPFKLLAMNICQMLPDEEGSTTFARIIAAFYGFPRRWPLVQTK